MAFLHEYGLQDDFKLNIEPNHTTLAGHEASHDIYVASIYGMLGSIDSNTGDTMLGWDTDNFPMDVAQSTAIMGVVLEQGGLGAGGLNFDCKVRRESVEPVDLFLGHIGAMDTYALGLRKAAKMFEEGTMKSMVQERYLSWQVEAMGQKIENGEATLEECAEYAKSKGEPKKTSGKQELYEMVRNGCLYG
jgi:xylose isomerase